MSKCFPGDRKILPKACRKMTDQVAGSAAGPDARRCDAVITALIQGAATQGTGAPRPKPPTGDQTGRRCSKRSKKLVLSFLLWSLLGLLCMNCNLAEDNDSCIINSNPTGIDGGLQCGDPFNLNETDSTGDPIGPGVFGVKVVEYVHVNAAGIVETDTISVLLFIIELDHQLEHNSAKLGFQLCQIQIPKVDIPGQPEPTVFRVLPEMMPNIPLAVVDAELSGNSTCDTFKSERAITIIGACLENQLEDDLPGLETCSGSFDTSQKDTYCETRSGCSYDVDEDGYPAATLEAENLPGLDVDLVFANMRSWVSMDGLVATSDMILGIAEFDLLVNPIGCLISPLGGGEPRPCNGEELRVVSRVNPDITQTPGQDSTFIAVRINSDATCEDIIENELEIFGR